MNKHWCPFECWQLCQKVKTFRFLVWIISHENCPKKLNNGWRRSLRFPALQKSVNLFIEEQKNKHTLSKTRRDVGLLFEFLKPKKENRKIEEIQPQDTNQWFSERVYSYCEKKRRGDYEPSSLKRASIVTWKTWSIPKASSKIESLSTQGRCWMLVANPWKKKAGETEHLQPRLSAMTK